MADPDYVVCLECDTPSYVFQWAGGTIVEAICQACGNDDPSLFCTEEELEEMAPGSGDEEEESRGE